MNTRQIVFTLNTTEAIIIDIFNDINDLYPCDEAVINFSCEHTHYILGSNSIREKFESFYNLLFVAINNQNQLHPSITQDIGFLWNEEMQNKPGLTYTKVENIDFWVGLEFLLWATPRSSKPILTTWLYNDLQGSIILEITPSYPWRSYELITDEAYIPYEEWIKTYKPLLTRIIPRDVAIAWKDKAKEVLDAIAKNVAEYK